MRWPTEDLLSLRDGEPLDAALRAQLESQPGARDEIRRLAALRETLRELPEIEPPADGWARIAASLVQPPRAPRAAARHGVATAAVATLVVVAAGALLLRTDPPARDPPSTPTERSSSAFDPAVTLAPDVRAAAGDYRSLVAESARLERLLMQLPRQRGIRPAGTASTIAGLEDQIAWIDALMSESAALGSDGAYRQALWQERVTVMNALLDVRYAQAPAWVY